MKLILCAAAGHGAAMTALANNQQPVRIRFSLEDGEIAGWCWANANAPALLFCHATGFCASAYKQMLQQLSADFDIYALDMRGHSRTSLPADPGRLRSWRVYARDVGAFLNAHGAKRWILSGHSMGAIAVALAAQARDDVDALALIEPVAIPRALALAASTPLWRIIGPRSPMASRAARRWSRLETRDEVMQSYVGKKLFADWAAGVLADYLEDGLTEAGEGAVRLACDPRWEAATFAALRAPFAGMIARQQAPVAIFAGRLGDTTMYPSARRRSVREGAMLTESARLSHLAPMQDPAACAEFIRKAAQNGLNPNVAN